MRSIKTFALVCLMIGMTTLQACAVRCRAPQKIKVKCHAIVSSYKKQIDFCRMNPQINPCHLKKPTPEEFSYVLECLESTEAVSFE